MGKGFPKNLEIKTALENLNKSLFICREMKIHYWPDKIQEVLDRS
jgi:hypothetical protein